MPIRNIVGLIFECTGRVQELGIDTLKTATSFIHTNTFICIIKKNCLYYAIGCVNMYDLYLGGIEYERREVTCWHFDNNSSYTCVASPASFFIFYFHFNLTELFMRCSSNFWTTTVASLLFFHRYCHSLKANHAFPIQWISTECPRSSFGKSILNLRT